MTWLWDRLVTHPCCTHMYLCAFTTNTCLSIKAKLYCPKGVQRPEISFVHSYLAALTPLKNILMQSLKPPPTDVSMYGFTIKL